MRQFSLKIVTPEGIVYEGPAESFTVRTTTGVLGILAGHIDLVAPIGKGECKIVINGKPRNAECMGGMVGVVDGAATLISSNFSWNE